MVQQMTMTGAGGSAHDPVASSITVDPGQIKQFAQFLDEMRGEIDALHRRMDELGVTSDHFGVHASSRSAGDAHARALARAVTNLDRLRWRADELVDGTNELSRLYGETEELNRTSAANVADLMDRKDSDRG